MSTHFLLIAGGTTASLLAGAGVCHLIPKLGAGGKRVAEAMCRAPGLDVLITYFTVLPLFVGPAIGGWWGFVAAVLGQVVGLTLWEFLHELANPEAVRGPRIVRTINAKVGMWRNYAATWVTAIVTPLFWFVRLAQIFLYPLLTMLVRLPPYRSSEWVNVSRQKFSGLVGHDLIWCLYCDWMTGVWSLGSEMLRNVESFWCPIRFRSDKKCANCVIDFPDIDGGWVPATGTMAQVVAVLDGEYPEKAPDAGAFHPWFGHPVRVTVGGRELRDGLDSASS
jgi:hypothetical protein